MNRVDVNIPSDLSFERVVRASAAELGAQMGFAPERIEDLKLALSEAVTNAIEHGSAEAGSSSVEVSFILHPDKLEVAVRDHGHGVEKLNFSRRVVEEENLDAGYLRGFGLYLIAELVDQYEVQSSPDGTVMTLRLFRKAPAEEHAG